jgi:hypothetical protein
MMTPWSPVSSCSRQVADGEQRYLAIQPPQLLAAFALKRTQLRTPA